MLVAVSTKSRKRGIYAAQRDIFGVQAKTEIWKDRFFITRFTTTTEIGFAGIPPERGTKTAARNYCNQLLREGRLMPQPHEIPTFEKFAKGWWEWDTCPYLKKRRGRREITKSYAKSAWRRLHTHILPYFGKKRLDRITEFDIDTWLTSYAEKGIRNNTANTFLNILVTMLNEAVRQKIIKANPALLVMKLKKDTKAIDILKPNEVKKIFPENWRKVWGDEYIAYVANKLAACTGMRFGEVLGLRGEFVHEDYIKGVRAVHGVRLC